jgi:hypothetical protein
VSGIVWYDECVSESGFIAVEVVSECVVLYGGTGDGPELVNGASNIL